MEIEYYNSEKLALTGKIINGTILLIAHALPWSPKVRLINKEYQEEDFKNYTSNIFLEAESCDEEKFKQRVLQVGEMSIAYPEFAKKM